MTAMRRSSDLKLLISIMVLHPMSRTSLDAESGSSAIYDSHHAVFSEIILIEDSDS
jgi:hypothetical protein